MGPIKAGWAAGKNEVDMAGKEVARRSSDPWDKSYELGVGLGRALARSLDSQPPEEWAEVFQAKRKQTVERPDETLVIEEEITITKTHRLGW